MLVATTAGGPGTSRDLPSGRPSETELRLRPVANAQDLADNVAARAAAEPGVAPAPEQWVYVKTVEKGSSQRSRTHEMWRRADEKRFAYMDNGKLKVVEGSEFEVAYPYLLSLPAEPAQLLARVYEEIDAEDVRRRASLLRRFEDMAERRGRSPEEARREAEAETPSLTAEQRNTYAFQHITQGMRDAALPPGLRAAMYGAMAKIPGVRYKTGSSDLAKRPGVTLYRVHEGYLRDEIFIDPKTYEYLGYRSTVVEDREDRRTYFSVKKGQLLGWGSLLKATVVDKPGDRS
ncbi:hypothetical protein [Nonomuraea dietziae]|uniref:hypothetical protein n=1 Tax=Nonomuraea dietziae TaxID=65515 RepID=UPI00340FDFA9